MQRTPNQAPSSRIETSQPLVLELSTAEAIRFSNDLMLMGGSVWVMRDGLQLT